MQVFNLQTSISVYFTHVFLKENYFGVSQIPTEFDAFKSGKKPSKNDIREEEAKNTQDARYYRPMHANITVVLLDIKAELTKVSTIALCLKAKHALLNEQYLLLKDLS